MSDEPRLSRQEAHDLSMLIKDRSKVLKAHAEEQAAVLLADFEVKLAAEYKFDDDEVWKRATIEAMEIVRVGNEKIAARCEKMGIPKQFAPSLELSWRARGENLAARRRTELTKIAKSQIEAMQKAAITRIEKQSLDLRTQVVSMGMLSANGKLFLESVAPVEEAMTSLDFKSIQKQLDDESRKRDAHMKRLGYDGSYE